MLNNTHKFWRILLALTFTFLISGCSPQVETLEDLLKTIESTGQKCSKHPPSPSSGSVMISCENIEGRWWADPDDVDTNSVAPIHSRKRGSAPVRRIAATEGNWAVVAVYGEGRSLSEANEYVENLAKKTHARTYRAHVR